MTPEEKSLLPLPVFSTKWPAGVFERDYGGAGVTSCFAVH